MRAALMGFCLFWCSLACAVIVQGGDGSANVTGVGAGAGWDYVGSVGSASGVYLGDYGGSYWVLTAGHVGEGAFTLNGITYQAVGPAFNLLNDADAAVDLVLFRIDGDPGLPALSLIETPLTLNQSVVMIGYGTDRAAGETYWTLAWQETANSQLGFYKGYKWGPTATKRWGQNTISETNSIVGNTEYFTTTFSLIAGSTQATAGDSGGGVFVYQNGSWELAGSMGLVGTFSGQPSSTSVYGDLTYAADISIYRSQILEIVSAVPEPSVFALLAAAGVVVAVRRARKARVAPR